MLQTRRTIITTIHQPSSRMFYMFDKLLLISDGHAIYHGKARDCMHHFSSLGFVPEIPMNPAEFLLDLATGNLDDISVPEALRGSPDPQEFRSQVIRHLQLKFRAGGGAGAESDAFVGASGGVVSRDAAAAAALCWAVLKQVAGQPTKTKQGPCLH